MTESRGKKIKDDDTIILVGKKKKKSASRWIPVTCMPDTLYFL